MEIKINLMRFLENMCEGAGVKKPIVVARNTYACRHSVLISFDGSKLPYPLMKGVSGLPKSFYGDDAHSVDAAEHKAIMCLVRDLRKTYDIQIHDTSHFKILSCQEKNHEISRETDRFVTRFHTFKGRYAACSDALNSTIDTTHPNYVHLPDQLISRVIQIVERSKSSIDELTGKIMKVCREDDAHMLAASSRTRKTGIFQAKEIIWNIYPKEILSEVLSLLGLDPPKYSNKWVDGDLYIGTCKVDIWKFYGPENTGKTMIEGETRHTPSDAENSAAASAISALERVRGFEVVDFNFSTLVDLRERHCALVQHRSKLESLFSEANQSWSLLISSIEEFIKAHHELSQSFPLSGEASDEWTARTLFVSDLEEKVFSLKHEHYSAILGMSV